MIDFKDIMTLLNAGYTKADIDAMTSQAAPVNEPAPEKPVTATEKPAEEAKPAPVTDNTPDVFNALGAELKALNAEVKNLRAQLQRDALLMDGTKGDVQDDSMRILASIINPPEKK